MNQILDLSTARRIAVAAAGFPVGFGSGSEGTLAAIRHLGAVQIDTISVVERAHHHVLRSRVRNYRPEHIPALEASPRRVIEYWSHAAAYLPLEEWRFALSRMERIRENGHEWFRAESKAIAYVRDRIAEEGPLRAQDFAEPMRGPRGWWDWKPAKVALEYLFHAGELIVCTRKGFQKVYDLPERALPPELDTRRPTSREEAEHHVDRAAAALGIFSRDEVAYMRKDGVENIDAEIDRRLESGRLVEIRLAGRDVSGLSEGDEKRPRTDRPYYAPPAAIESVSAEPTSGGKPQAFLLSPFDPLIIDRRRTSRLFALDYTLECYVPAPKRRFGYFALPLLFVDTSGQVSFPALADVRMDRKRKELLVRRLSLDLPPGNPRRRSDAARRDFARALAQELTRFSRGNGAEELKVERIDCVSAPLEREFRGALSAAQKSPGPTQA